VERTALISVSKQVLLKRWMFFLAIGFFMALLPVSCGPSAGLKVYEWQIEGGPEDNFNEAQFRLWMPQRDPVEGILVVVLGGNMFALHLADDVGWQNLAKELNYGLLALNFTDASNGKTWSTVEGGSGKASNEGLSKLSAMAHSEELSQVPMALVGLSTGGQFAYHFALWKPARVSTFITMKGGFHRLPLTGDNLSMPGLIIRGSNDLDYRKANLNEIHRIGRKR